MQLIKMNESKPAKKALMRAVSALRKGGLVVFPTETVYGLGASVSNRKAVDKIFRIKGRPTDNPLIVHIGKIKQLDLLAKEVGIGTERLIEKFWPGPLTLILKKKQDVPSNVTAGLDTVAVRMPSNRIARKLAEIAGPIAAPSANKSGGLSPTDAEHAIEDLTETDRKKIGVVIDAGKTEFGLESTVFDPAKKLILRPGPITLRQLRRYVPETRYSTNSSKHPQSPGMKYKHYSPKAELILFIGNREKIAERMKERRDGRTAVLKLDGNKKHAAETVYSKLREFDRSGFKRIICEGIDEKGLGYTIMDRLKKAASEIVTVR